MKGFIRFKFAECEDMPLSSFGHGFYGLHDISHINIKCTHAYNAFLDKSWFEFPWNMILNIIKWLKVIVKV